MDLHQVTWPHSGWVPQPCDRMRLYADTKQQPKARRLLRCLRVCFNTGTTYAQTNKSPTEIINDQNIFSLPAPLKYQI
jgi:hypothetical protein